MISLYMPSFWLNDPLTLLNQQHVFEIWPSESMPLSSKLNAVTRLVLLLSVVGYLLTNSQRFLLVGGLTLAAIVAFYISQPLKEGYENSADLPPAETSENTVPTTVNPMMNVLLTEYKDKPNRKPALPINDTTTKWINDKVKSKIVSRVGDARILRGMNNELELEHSMRNFYTTPNTAIPNDQEGFSNFCYGEMISGKEGNQAALERKGARIGPISV